MRPWLVLTLLLACAPAGAQVLQESVTEVWVHDVPGPPQGDFWHPVAGHILSSFMDPASIYPNVEVCARPLTVATPHCARICWEFKGDSHGNGQPSTECQRPLRVRLVPSDPRMLLEVIDMEHVGDRAQVHAVIARNIVVPDPSHCSDDHPCKLKLPQGYNTARGTLALSFRTQVHGVLGASPPPSLPTAALASAGSAAPVSATPTWQPALDWARRAWARLEGLWGASSPADKFNLVCEHLPVEGVDKVCPSFTAFLQGASESDTAQTACYLTAAATANGGTQIVQDIYKTCTRTFGNPSAFEGCVETYVKRDDTVVPTGNWANCLTGSQQMFESEVHTLSEPVACIPGLPKSWCTTKPSP